jgi:hypothetical protein
MGAVCIRSPLLKSRLYSWNVLILASFHCKSEATSDKQATQGSERLKAERPTDANANGKVCRFLSFELLEK